MRWLKEHGFVMLTFSAMAVLLTEASVGTAFCQCVTSDPRYINLTQRGQQAKDAGNWSDAIESFEQALHLQPGCSALKTQLGGIYYNSHDYAKALTYFQQALVANPQDFYAARFGGSSGYWLNKYGEAVRLLNRAKAIRPHDASAYYWLGQCYYAQGDRQRAAVELETAAHYDPKDVEILYLLGEVHWELSQEAWDTMEKSDPASYRVEQMIAERDVLLALYPDAIKEYQLIIQQKPDMPGFHEALGKLYLRLSEWSNAEHEFGEELRLDPESPSSHCELGEALFQQQNLPEALANANKAVAEKADYGEAYELLGRIYMHLGRKQEAISTLEHATHLLPAAPSPYYMLAHLYSESGQPQLANQAREKYQELMTEQKKENSPGLQ